MAYPILASIYPALARFGYGVARAIRPSNVLKGAKKVTPESFKATSKSPILEGIKNKVYNPAYKSKDASGSLYGAYRDIYKGTLGSETKRKVTSGVLGTYATMSFLDGDDDIETIE
jgi:hypothetical protein